VVPAYLHAAEMEAGELQEIPHSRSLSREEKPFTDTAPRNSRGKRLVLTGIDRNVPFGRDSILPSGRSSPSPCYTAAWPDRKVLACTSRLSDGDRRRMCRSGRCSLTLYPGCDRRICHAGGPDGDVSDPVQAASLSRESPPRWPWCDPSNPHRAADTGRGPFSCMVTSTVAPGPFLRWTVSCGPLRARPGFRGGTSSGTRAGGRRFTAVEAVRTVTVPFAVATSPPRSPSCRVSTSASQGEVPGS